MNLTFEQKKVLRQSGMCKITYRNMFKKDHDLGYCSKGGYFYEVNLAKDVRPVDVQLITLIHECGHIALYHVHTDVPTELKTIEGLCKKYNKPAYMLQAYGGPMAFLNICMDIEVNNKYLTKANTDFMAKCGFPLCTLESYQLTDLGDFRNYYEPLIQKLPDNDKDYQQMVEQMKQALKDMLDNAKKNKNQQGQGQGKGTPMPGTGNGQPQPGQGQGQPIPLPEWAKDIVDSAMEQAMNELGDEFKDELAKEGYADGNSKAKYQQGEDKKGTSGQADTTIDEAVDQAEEQAQADATGNGSEQTASSRKQSYGIGTSHVEKGNEFGEIVECNDKNIRKFMNQFINIGKEYRVDYLKHYNHGSRENKDGILYSSMKRHIQETKTKIAILVDVSGSMDAKVLLDGLGAIKAAENVIDKDSVLVTWDTHKCQEFNIRNIPTRVREGGGTDMASGVKYLVKKGFKKVVLYSDMETDVSSIIDLMKAKEVEMYTICTDSYEESRLSEEMKNYFRLNKAVLRVK